MPPEFSSDSNLELPDSCSSKSLEGNNVDINKKRENKYHCSVGNCKQTFRRQDHLDRHEYKHTGIVSRIGRLL